MPADAAEYRRLRLSALREAPTAFGRSYAEESLHELSFFAARLENTADHWTIGAFSGQRLVGIVSLVRDERLKAHHKASIYGMYVDPRWQQRGIGRELLEHVIAVASDLDGLKMLRLGVVSSNRPARKLYAALGFRTYGEEPLALQVDGRYYAEKLMALVLKPAQRNRSIRQSAAPKAKPTRRPRTARAGGARARS